jgi:predicted nucleotidyltransferase
MSSSIEQSIASGLRQLNPDTVILFGSQSKGNPTPESDWDLVVVLAKDDEPQSFQERMALVHEVRDALKDINDKYSLDLLVYTRPQWEKFISKNSGFSRAIQREGRRIA